jgi:hypothetical protein
MEAKMENEIETLKSAPHLYAEGFSCALVKREGELILELINENGICLGEVYGPKVPEVWVNMTGKAF